MPILSAIVDGEATQAQILELRPHLRNCLGCRGRLKAMRDSSEPLAAVFPLPVAAAALSSTEPASNAFLRLYETVATGLHDRAAYSVSKAQALLEASAAGKVTAVAASAAAVAGGGYASVERSVSGLAVPDSARPKMQREAPDRVRTANPPQATVTGPASPAHLPAPAPQAQSKDEFANSKTPITRAAPEFGVS